MKSTLKILVAGCLTVAIICSNLSATTFAASAKSADMDNLDVMIAAHYFLASKNEGKDFWTDSLSNVEIIPLYNTSGKITSYYVELPLGGYAVINNNIENPTTIEFGAENNPLIREILDKNQAPHIIYNNPLSIYDEGSADALKNTEDQIDLYQTYPDLQEPNSELATMLSEQKATIENESQDEQRGGGGYGFIDWENMPSGSYSYDNIPYSGTNWMITDDFDDFAKEHCGATAITNLALYFANQGFSNLNKGSGRDTFMAVYAIVGNGPEVTIANNARKYFSDCGYTLNHSPVGDFIGIKGATQNDRPCGILLADGIFKWHWILSVGYREYSTGDGYIRIMDGWRRTVDRFYKPGSGSAFISATQYWM